MENMLASSCGILSSWDAPFRASGHPSILLFLAIPRRIPWVSVSPADVSFLQQSAEWLPGPYSGGPNLTMGCPQHKQLPNRHVIHCLYILTQY